MSNDDCSAKCPKCGHSVKVGMKYGFPDYHRIKHMMVYCPIQSCDYEDKWFWDEKDNYLKKQPEPPKISRKTFTIEYTKDTIFGEKYIRDSLNYRIMGDPFIEVVELSNLPIKTCNNCGSKMEYWYANSNKTYCPFCYNGTDTVKDKKEQKRWKKYLEKYPEKLEETLEEMKEDMSKGTNIPKEILFPEDHGNDDLQASGDYEAMMDIAKQAIKNSKDPEMFKDIELKLDFTKSCSNCGWDINNHCENSTHCDKDYSEWKPIEIKKKKTCDNCGWQYYSDDDLQCCKCPKDCFEESEWKPKKEENKEKQAWKGEIPPTYPNEKKGDF